MSIQPQLFNIALDQGDVVYTPEWVVCDMVSYFKPEGKILEPCAGDGIFLKHLPDETLWCEIQRGRDFFKWTEPVDWIVGNPPFKTVKEWLIHSFKLSENVLFVLPMNSPFNSMGRMKLIFEYGGIRSIRAYGHGSLFGLDYGFAIGAFHFQRDYSGETKITIGTQTYTRYSKRGRLL